MSPLPPPLTRVTVPELFPVSAVARYRGCKLRLIASTREWRDSHLVSGPDAVIGTVVHRVYERWPADASVDPLVLLERELERERAVLAADPRRAHFADLAKTRSFVEWRNLRATVRARCATLSKRKAADKSAGGSSVQGSQAEQQLSDRTRRLVGRVDRFERIDQGRFRIRDFKTGHALATDGTPIPEISLQVRLYALLSETALPGANILLTVDVGGREFEIEWNSSARADTLRHLAEATGDIPAGTEQDAVGLARPGGECWQCSIRHRCRAYFKVAPSWWLSLPLDLGAIPADSWGNVIERGSRSSRTAIRLRDAADREVNITGLRDRPGMDEIAVGTRLFLFGLARTGSGIGWNGRRFQPHAFHESATEQGDGNAWALEIYTG